MASADAGEGASRRLGASRHLNVIHHDGRLAILVREVGRLVGAEDPVEEGEPLGEVRERLLVVHRVLRALELEAAQLGDNAHRVAVWRPRELGVAEKLDRVRPANEAGHVEERVGQDGADHLKADEVRAQDGERLDGRDGVGLVRDELAVLLGHVRVVLRVDPAVELAVLVAGAVEGVEAQVEADVEERRAPDRVQDGAGRRPPRRDVEDAEADGDAERLGARHRNLLQNLVLGEVLHGPALVPVGEPLRRLRLKHPQRKEEEPRERRAVVAVAHDEVAHGDDDDVARPPAAGELEPRDTVVARRCEHDVEQVEDEAGGEHRGLVEAGVDRDRDPDQRQQEPADRVARPCERWRRGFCV